MTRHLSLLAALAALGTLSACPPTSPTCDPPETACNSVTCVNLDVDPQHCGTCDTACASGETCVSGVCTCTTGTLKCGNICVTTNSDPLNCGACGVSCGGGLCVGGKCGPAPDGGTPAATDGGTTATDGGTPATADGGDPSDGGCVCPTGQSCVQGVCTSTVFAACFNTGELVALDDNLVAQPASAIAGGGPETLATNAGTILVGDTIDNALYRFDPKVTPLARQAGSDALDPSSSVNQLVVSGGKAYAVNSGVNLVEVIDLTKPAPTAAGDKSRVIDEIPTATTGSPTATGTNPLFATFAGGKLYVTLLGDCINPTSTVGNALLELDVSAVPGTVTRELDFNAADYAKDPSASGNDPRPAGIAAIGSKLYVAIGNLVTGCYDPVGGPSGGPGYLAVVDTSANPLAAVNVKLPDACRNPYFVLASSNRVYVSCSGSYGITATAQEALVVIDPSNLSVVNTTTFARCADPNATGPTACKTAVPGRLALHGSELLISDSNSGRLLVTDLNGAIPDAFKDGVSLCPLKCPGGDTTAVCDQFVSDVLALQ